MARKKRSASTAKSRTRKPSSTDHRIEVMKRFIRTHGNDFLKDPNINSIGIGYKNDAAGELALQFAVNQKVAPEAVAEVSGVSIPKEISFEGVKMPTDVVQRSFKPGYKIVHELQKDARKQRFERIVPGISIGHVKSTAGTLGCLVLDQRSGEVALLSNWHVFHGAEGQVGDDIVQPGPFDDNRIEANRVGKLLRSHLGVAGDCAIASIEGRSAEPVIYDLHVPVGKIGKPELGDTVVKSGRTTAVTYGRVTRVETMTKMNYDGQVVSVGGFEIGPDPKKPAKDNEISRGGDSGSAWLATKNGKPTDVMLGLHFAGDAEGSDGEFALACYAHSVFEKLEIVPFASKQAVTQAAAKKVEAREDLRLGFRTDFLSFEVPFPKFTSATRDDLVRFQGSDGIAYCHFSVWLSRERKFPRVVAWNIDGGAVKALARTGIPFKKDERGNLEDYQIGDELYASNPFDRGHVARRADLCWGPKAEAMQANRDSFFFTNMTPQHQSFNQSSRGGLWGRLENAIFEDVEVENLRVSLMGGPILRDDDPEYRDIARVPREFWKVIAYKDEADGENKVRAFILTQKDLVRKVIRPQILELEEFHWYQVPLDAIEADTGVRFAAPFKALDTMATGPQAVGAPSVRLIQTDADFFA